MVIDSTLVVFPDGIDPLPLRDGESQRVLLFAGAYYKRLVLVLLVMMENDAIVVVMVVVLLPNYSQIALGAYQL
jgi:hypothetical protein